MDIGKLFIIAGVVLVIVGIGWSFGLGRLPGDISVKNGNFTFYFPIVTSIIVSIILTIVLNLFLRR
ncbi:MAG: hypothetical protein K0S68_189 [Candidatus Saccharibacteria bacterium]|jgi:hypothetical protein|nr:hypothetical protein [Candidatus Saccharibacteria bacterium]